MNLQRVLSSVIAIAKAAINPEKVKFSSASITKNKLLHRRVFEVRKQKDFDINPSLKFNKFLEINKKFDSRSNSLKLDANNFSKSMLMEEMLRSLRVYGAVIVENAFSLDVVNAFADKAKNLIDDNTTTKLPEYITYTKNPVSLHYDPFLLAPIITGVLDRLCTRSSVDMPMMAYVREIPQTHLTRPNASTQKHWVGGWHVDFPTEVKISIILEDINEYGTKMQLLPYSHLLPLVPGKHYSPRDIERLNLRIINCYGPKGTLYIHRGVTLHRNLPSIGVSRFLYSATYTYEEKFPFIEKEKIDAFIDGSFGYIDKLRELDRLRLQNLLSQNSNKIVSKRDLSYV